MDPPAKLSGGEPLATRLPLTLALLLAGAALAVWLWSASCTFPSIVWNDVRLAPTIALAQGRPIFPTANHGTINTWTYGPLPPLYYLPASLATSAGGALTIAGLLNLALTLVPLALVCFVWPAGEGAGDIRLGRTAAFLLCVAVWPPRHYAVIFADNLAIACGLAGNLLLVRARGPRELWLAAFAACAAVGCKQIAVGIPLAQVLWLGLTAGGRAAGWHALRCTAVGVGLLAGAVAGFGGAGLWFVLIDLPADFPWSVVLARLTPMAPEAAWQIGVPLVVMVAARRVFVRPTLLLPALAWACTLPFGVMALLKTGGWLNSLHSLALWLPPVVTLLLTTRHADHVQRWVRLGAAVAAALIACSRVLQTPRLLLRPAVASYAEAEQFAAQFHGRIWFPLHPLVTLYSENRYYHDEDGLYVRQVSKKGVGPEQTAAHLPPAMQVLALHNSWSDWGVARSLLSPDARPVVMGNWTLWLPTENPPRR